MWGQQLTTKTKSQCWSEKKLSESSFNNIFNAIYTLNSILFYSIGDEEGAGADCGRCDGVGGGDESCISIPGPCNEVA